MPSSSRGRCRGTPIPDAFIVLAARAVGASPIYTFDAGLSRDGIAVAEP